MSEFETVIWIGTGVLTLAFFPITWFVIDYGILTPIRRRASDEYEPWWTSGIGWMWFGLGVSMMLTSAVVLFARIMTSVAGPAWPGREWITLGVYTVVAAVIVLTVFVYAIEKRTPGLVLINSGRRAREAERAERNALERRAGVHTGPVDLIVR